MLRLNLATAEPPVRRVLALGCHADDIEIGCGGTLLQLARSIADLHVTWVVLAASGVRADEARASAAAFLQNVSTADVQIHDFRESFLPSQAAEVKELFEGLKPVEPDLVLTHTRDDLHQDHRLACELTWNTFRDHLILEYEVPKYDGDLGRPNVFVPLLRDIVDEKVRLILEHFKSQAGKHWFDEEIFRSIARIRGVESATAHAEAFTGRKLRLMP